jgi:hypothetical protein
VSVAGFAPWALGGLGRELATYLACAAVFIGLSGPLLHGLIAGPGALWRFSVLFGVAFTANSAAWIAGWMLLHGHTGSLVGLFAGTALMGGIFALAFGAPEAAWKCILALFVLNTLGYYVGGWVEGVVAKLPNLTVAGLATEKPAPPVLAMISWGVCYGIGLGAGLGLSFYWCQSRLRALLGQ